MSILVIDVGTSSVRASVVRPDATLATTHSRPLLPHSPAAGFVEFDPRVLADAALATATLAIDEAGPVAAVGITNQRASTVLWDRASGTPVGPGVSWQDQRTVGMCLILQSEGLRVAPNTSATKLAFLLDMADPGRDRDLAFGTIDTWLAWTLSDGALHVTDASNAALTGLITTDASGWAEGTLDALRIPPSVLPTIVDSSGAVGPASALPGAPPISGLAGDQQASLMGQGCTRPGDTKITFGTGGMLDRCSGADRPPFETLGPSGCFPVVAWRRQGRLTWGVEAAMLSAGTSVEWLRDDLGIIETAGQSESVAAACERTGDVWFVPALLGLGTPMWDFGARGTFLGLTRGTGRPELVRAVLEGVAHRGADLVEAAEADGGPIDRLRVDGGMTANGVFVQALADTTQRVIEVSPVLEATTLGAAYLAGMADGTWSGEEEVASAWQPARVVEPRRRPDRDRWRQAVERARGWVPELSALHF
jgi:glycerol kinase